MEDRRSTPRKLALAGVNVGVKGLFRGETSPHECRFAPRRLSLMASDWAVKTPSVLRTIVTHGQEQPASAATMTWQEAADTYHVFLASR